MNYPLHRRGCERHPLLMELHEPPHIRFPIMQVQCFDLFRPVLLDIQRNGFVLQALKLFGVLRLDLGQSRKLGFDGLCEIIRIKRQGR